MKDNDTIWLLVPFIIAIAMAMILIFGKSTESVSAPAVPEIVEEAVENPEATEETTEDEGMRVPVQEYEYKEPLKCTRWIQYIPINGMLYPIYHTSCK